MNKFRIDQLVVVFILIVVFLAEGAIGLDSVQTPLLAKAIPVKLLEISSLPTAVSIESISFEKEADKFVSTLSAQAVYVMDGVSATPLLVKNESTPLYPASTTKLLTALTSLTFFSVTDEVQIPPMRFEYGNRMGLQVGETISLKNLLYGLLLNSDNDAAFVLAEVSPVGQAGFVVAMNELAHSLNLNQTHMENPAGFDSANHLSTAKDLAILAKEVVKNPNLAEIVGTKELVVMDTAQQRRHYLRNTNELLGVEVGLKGLKTGTTPLAGEVLISWYELEDREIFIVVLGSKDRYTDTKLIKEWVLTHYQWQRP